jgi:hypothetical protein
MDVLLIGFGAGLIIGVALTWGWMTFSIGVRLHELDAALAAAKQIVAARPRYMEGALSARKTPGPPARTRLVAVKDDDGA